MRLRGKLLVAGLIAVVGIAALGLALSRTGGVRDYLAAHYTRVSANGESVVYSAAREPGSVYEDVRSEHPPADSLIRPSGYYLRYSDDIVAIVPKTGGSRIYVDDEDRGYARWFPIIAPVWGTYGSPGGVFRGGGPGAGK